MRWTSIILACGAVALLCSPAAGQEAVEASRSQRKLIQQGLDAHANGEFGAAAEHFRAANAQGELNIVWLNLGRALQKGGECDGAKAAYERALTAPAVPKPPQDLVDETARKYRAELDDECPGALRVVCAQPDIGLDVDGKALACGETLALAPGTYAVRALWNGQEKEESAEVVAFETASVTFGFTRPTVPGSEPGGSESAGGLGVYAWVATGVAVALIGTGAVVAVQRGDTIDEANATRDEERYRSLRDDYDGQSTLMWTTFGLGLAAGTAAGFLFCLDAQDAPGGVGWRVGPASVAVQLRF